ncbi:MAG: AsmA-like C-terminal region-containing protein, partial [Opitutae bacterium]
IHSYSKSFPSIHANFRGFLNHTGGKIYISQKEGNDERNQEIKDFLTELSWNTESENEGLLGYRFHSQAERLRLNTKSANLNFFYPVIHGNGVINLNTYNLLSGDIYFTYKNLSVAGAVSGNLPPLDLTLHHENAQLKAHIFSDTNGTKISLHAEKNKDGWIANGAIKLIPQLYDLYAQLPQGNLRVMDGQELYIRLWENPTPTRADSPIQFLVSADDFSALQTPPGQFLFTGEIKSDFTIHINDAYGKLGLSEVTGTYYQKWNPAKYRFLLNGSCHPPDINNWLGIWWSPLWGDFSFSSAIPVGNFSIEGIWAGQPGNSVTIGQVKTKELVFRNFPFNSCLLDIEVDGSSTRLLGKKMMHNYGSIKGNLSFPRSIEPGNLLLGFSFEGDFPVNEAKGILGEGVEEGLSEVNATSIYCEASGEVFKQDEVETVDHNLSWYGLYLSTDKPFSYAGIDIDYARGEISNSNGLIRGKFDDFGFAEGQGKLSFSDTSPYSDRISITLDLKNVDRQKLFQNLSNSPQWQKNPSSQKDDQINEDSEPKQATTGKINLSMQAEGPVSDAKYFEGPGNLVLHDVDIGSIHLLGGIRNKLGAFNLPLPSDALNFNELVVPFALEHDRVIFDRARLSGPLSKFEAIGEVNWVRQEVDLLADFKLAGNLNIPVLKQIVNWADPLSKLSKLKIQGEWENPEWSVHLGAGSLKT